ncbi:hypothetical protein PTKIN_Ptkin06aG0085400 [Pterospermum kingtungense]
MLDGHANRLPLQHWVRSNLDGNINDGKGPGWESRFAAVVWWLWKWRNAYVFTGEQCVLSVKLALLRRVWDENDLAFNPHCPNKAAAGSRKKLVMIRWLPPPVRWWKLNTDGSCQFQGVRSVYHGLVLAWNRGCRKVLLELDSQVVQQCLVTGITSVHHLCYLLARYQELLNREWTVFMLHTYREANVAADWLALFGLKLGLGMHVLDEPSDALAQILLGDV